MEQKKISVNSFKAMGTSKGVLYKFLAHENKVFLPPKKVCSDGS